MNKKKKINKILVNRSQNYERFVKMCHIVNC